MYITKHQPTNTFILFMHDERLSQQHEITMSQIKLNDANAKYDSSRGGGYAFFFKFLVFQCMLGVKH